jgi:hypothetical protein
MTRRYAGELGPASETDALSRLRVARGRSAGGLIGD